MSNKETDQHSHLHPLMQEYLRKPDGSISIPRGWGEDCGLAYVNRCLKEGIKCKQPNGTEVDPKTLISGKYWSS